MEHTLYNEMIDATYKYYEYIKPIWTEKFLNETREYVWDIDHPLYNSCILKQHDESKCTEDVKRLYKKLALKYHPDKCNNPLIFPQIHELYIQGHIKKLQQIEQCNTIDNVLYLIDSFNRELYKELSKEQQIEKWKMQIWYQWNNPESIFKLIFITKDELCRRVQQRQYEIQVLQQEIQELKFKISNLSHTP